MQVSENKLLAQLHNSSGPTRPSIKKVNLPNYYVVRIVSEFFISITPSASHICTYLYDKPDTTYQPQGNTWTYRLQDHAGLLKALRTAQPKVTIDGPPLSAIECLDKFNVKQPSDVSIELVCTLKSRLPGVPDLILKEFQREGLLAVARRNFRILIADEMGLGKTVQALAAIKTYQANNPTDNRSLLIIAESSHCTMWRDMVKKYITGKCGELKDLLVQPKGEGMVVIETYTKARMLLEEVEKRKDPVNMDLLHPSKFFMAVVDESHRLMNQTSKRSMALVPFLTSIDHVILLSGTPALSRPSELYAQIKIICPSLYQEHEYHERYCKLDETHLSRMDPRWKKARRYTGSINLEELHYFINRLVMIRRLKSDCIQLGQKKRVVVSFKTELSTRQTNIKITGGKVQPPETMLAYNQAASEKIPDVIRFLTAIRKQTNKKIIIFAHHKEMLSAIELVFSRRCIRIDGGTTQAMRNSLCEEFKSKPEIDTAVLSIKTCSTGLTLVCASVVIFAELSWTPGDHLQAEDRVYRIGQTSSVSIYYLFASYIDRMMWPILVKKINNLEKLGFANKSSIECTTLPYDPDQATLFM
ncbi:SWI/SNF-related matrix-associated actin-dependent regulator of chromatin subfamily A-like protein 1 [Nematocida homosporus]|uniref:SWI/SNF-related matrix-associated actin-dependent regulator of chromatin subfamily A-like protein 1 n=1 Tax=Nematocida homosporus TaxID=1912981 RepID=UPI00221EC618|nr:SWI/SNF-related matrix-associated actin-dependent regulator of chromatin subfamily A-like protein 1 [Nematocida homosporus]KAI5185142.1 SWI/SNF-related matrix-associated actin-dependent regulator of chromatin subfamily A-like protein 1 [Nematocida homosporus]